MATMLYVGYMDEEVASLLRVVLQRQPTAQVVLFERGFLSTPLTELLEVPITELTAISAAKEGVRPYDVVYHDMQELVQSKAGKVDYGDYLLRRLDRRLDRSQERKVLSSVITEVRFGAAGAEAFDAEAEAEPLYFVRAPEMGKQPGVVRMYLRMVIRYLKTARGVDELDLACYGAGGGIVPGGKPGALHPIMASVFVGPDIDDTGERFANVELIYWKDEDTFIRTAPVAVGGHGPLTERAEQIFYGDRMLPQIREIFRTNPELAGMVSGTFSYFDSSETKRAVDRSYNDLVVWRVAGKRYSLSDPGTLEDHAVEMLVPATSGAPPLKDERKGTDFIVNANMEDYHLLRVAASMSSDDAAKRNYPTLRQGFILRADTNVVASKELEEVVEAYVNDKLLDVTLAKADYQALIDWGKAGCPFRAGEIAKLPVLAVTWQSTLGLDGNVDLLAELATFWFDEGGTPHLGLPEGDEDLFCMEPFCVEIATDFRGTPPEDGTGLWYRGKNKWKGLLQPGFLVSGDDDTKTKLALPENLDRMLYKSSGAPVLQVKAYEADELFTKGFGGED